MEAITLGLQRRAEPNVAVSFWHSSGTHHTGIGWSYATSLRECMPGRSQSPILQETTQGVSGIVSA